MNTHVKEAGFGKRLLAYLIDAACVIIMTAIFYTFVTSTYLYGALGGKKDLNEMNSFAVDSSLLSASYDSNSSITSISAYVFTDTKDTSGAPKEQTKAGYAEYFDKVWHYYTVFLPTDGRTIKKTTELGTAYTQDDYEQFLEVKLMKFKTKSAVDALTLTGDPATDDATLAGDNLFFKYATKVVEGKTVVDIAAMPVLRYSIQQDVDNGVAARLTALNEYMYSSAATDSNYGLYGNAIVDLTGGTSSQTSIQTYYSDRSTRVNYDIWVSVFVPFSVFQLIFFFVIPLCLKNGETLGKLTLSLGTCKIDGFKITLKEKIIRQFLTTALGMLVILPWTYIGIMAYVLIALVDYMVLVMSKTHQSLHDRLAKTECYDKKASLVFIDEADMAEYASTHPEQFPELKDVAKEQENSQIAAEDSILDLSTLNKNRDEAKGMTSFDDYEKSKEQENATKASANPQPKVNLTKDETPDEPSDDQAMKDLAALDGGTPDDKGDVKPEETKTSEEKPNEEGFTDDPEKKNKE
jgi:uncharacterized RDD family membrane protein YckC